MHISDIRPHDMTGDFVVLSERRLAEAKASEKLQVNEALSLCLVLLS